MFTVTQEPEFVEKSCNNLWEFTPDMYEITKGHLTAIIANNGEVLQIAINTNPVYTTVLIGRCWCGVDCPLYS